MNNDPIPAQSLFNRRTFLKSTALVSGASVIRIGQVRAADDPAAIATPAPAAPAASAPPVVIAAPVPYKGGLPAAKITRIRVYTPPVLNTLFNQSNLVLTVETDIGITGVGEGGSRDTIEQCAGRLIGRNPFDIDRCWQDMYRAFFYPPGREKIHGLGALDMALWDIKGKALGVPIYDLHGGMARNYCETYFSTGGTGAQLRDHARAAMDAGFRCFRIDSASLPPGNTTYESHNRVRQVIEDCKNVREGVGKDGDWIIDLHQRFDFCDAMRACKQLEELEPYYVEDPVRTEAFLEDIPKLRQLTTVPLAAGEEWGQRWDFNKLVESHDIDYLRATMPNVGGITEMKKIAAICETHFVGMAPHFTGPISTAALVHAIGPFSGPLIIEIGGNTHPFNYLPDGLDFKDGKIWPNKRPGLGVTLDTGLLTPLAEFTQAVGGRITYQRPDGSQTNW
jgi:L-alanine-DL-glutamate epimerase-like enolase superfamily enzyme